MKQAALWITLLILLAASACSRDDRLSQRLTNPGPASAAPTVTQAPAAEDTPEDVSSDPQTQELMELLDQVVQENQAGDAFEDLP